MEDKTQEQAIHELQSEVAALLRDRKEIMEKHMQLFQARHLRSETFDAQMWRFRNYAGEVIRRWKPAGAPLNNFLELAIVDSHDAAIDAYAALVSGTGAPALALFRRFYEMAAILMAGWQNPSGLQTEMEKALRNTRLDDHYAGLAKLGEIGAVMPSTRRVREVAATDAPGILEFERGLQSIGHGGLLAGMFYISDRGSDESQLEFRLEQSVEFAPFIESLIGASVGASWQILERLGYPGTYRGADARFNFSIIDAREDDVMEEFDNAFPRAFETTWSVLLGLSSIAIEISQKIGIRGYDAHRRRAQLVQDCFETGCLAMDFMFRGRLGGAATLVRRLFEMSLELQAWVRFEDEMTKRFASPTGQERTPSATSLIKRLHGPKDSANQRRTYSTLCSVAHGGIQSQEYLIDGDWKTGFKVQPAPVFVYRHHRWLFGTLISALDAALGGALLVGDSIDESIAANHGGYLQIIRRYTADTPELGLIRHEEAELPGNAE